MLPLTWGHGASFQLKTSKTLVTERRAPELTGSCWHHRAPAQREVPRDRPGPGRPSTHSPLTSLHTQTLDVLTRAACLLQMRVQKAKTIFSNRPPEPRRLSSPGLASPGTQLPVHGAGGAHRRHTWSGASSRGAAVEPINTASEQDPPAQPLRASPGSRQTEAAGGHRVGSVLCLFHPQAAPGHRRFGTAFPSARAFSWLPFLLSFSWLPFLLFPEKGQVGAKVLKMCASENAFILPGQLMGHLAGSEFTRQVWRCLRGPLLLPASLPSGPCGAPLLHTPPCAAEAPVPAAAASTGLFPTVHVFLFFCTTTFASLTAPFTLPSRPHSAPSPPAQHCLLPGNVSPLTSATWMLLHFLLEAQLQIWAWQGCTLAHWTGARVGLSGWTLPTKSWYRGKGLAAHVLGRYLHPHWCRSPRSCDLCLLSQEERFHTPPGTGRGSCQLKAARERI